MKSIVTFTYTDRKNSIFLDIWISYYSKIKNNKLIILYRNEAPKISDKFTELVKLININDKIENCNDYVIDIKIFNEYQKIFLEENDVVVYSDIDELIIHPDLDNLLQTFNSNFLVTSGVEIVQNVKLETKFDFNHKILPQRNYMIYSDWYNKPLILSNPHSWISGKHNNTNIIPEPDLLLVHLGKLCLYTYTEGWEETYLMYPGYKYKNLEDFSTDYILHWNDESHPTQPMISIPDDIRYLIDKNI